MEQLALSLPVIIFYLWLALAVIMVIIEIACTGILQIWFAIGAVCAAVVAKFYPDYYIAQLLTFLIVSAVLTFIGSRIFREKGDNPQVASNPVYSILGKTAIVTKEINTLEGLGQITINGDMWSAKTKDNEIIKENTKVTVLDIDGVKAVVKPIE